MTSVRSAKSKGSQFEYDCQHSLQLWTNHPVNRTSERGFQMQYDLRIDTASDGAFVFECKRHAKFSWNELVKTFEKLEKATNREPKTSRYLLFQPNRQPCLVFYKQNYHYCIKTFEDCFGITFEKHPSTRVKKDKTL